MPPAPHGRIPVSYGSASSVALFPVDDVFTLVRHAGAVAGGGRNHIGLAGGAALLTAGVLEVELAVHLDDGLGDFGTFVSRVRADH